MEDQAMTSTHGRTLTYKCAHCGNELNMDSGEVLDPDMSIREVADCVPPISCPKCGLDDTLELEDIEVDQEDDFTEEELAEEERPSASPTANLLKTARGIYLGYVVKGNTAGVVVRLAGGSVIFLNGKAATLKGLFGRRRLGSPVTVHNLGNPRKTSLEFYPDVLDAEAGKNN